MMFRRKIYDKLLQWKDTAAGEKALLVEGARRIGKSTIVREFAKREYKSFLFIDFNDASSVVKEAFDSYLNDLDTFFMILSTEYNVTLYPKQSLVVFDEIQKFPKARQSIKRLVQDWGRNREVIIWEMTRMIRTPSRTWMAVPLPPDILMPPMTQQEMVRVDRLLPWV